MFLNRTTIQSPHDNYPIRVTKQPKHTPTIQRKLRIRPINIPQQSLKSSPKFTNLVKSIRPNLPKIHSKSSKNPQITTKPTNPQIHQNQNHSLPILPISTPSSTNKPRSQPK